MSLHIRAEKSLESLELSKRQEDATTSEWLQRWVPPICPLQGNGGITAGSQWRELPGQIARQKVGDLSEVVFRPVFFGAQGHTGGCGLP